MLKFLKRLIFFIALTVLTQVGGVVYLLSALLSKKIQKSFYFKKVIVFSSLYLIVTFLIVPPLAKLNGRERVEHTENLKAAHSFIVLLNRNYVTPSLNAYLQKASINLKRKSDELEIRYLDACFPFFDGFPLLPHLSHNDGKKIDLSLVYQDQNAEVKNKSKSISGYGVFEEPLITEFDQTEYCKKKGYFQYDYPKYLTLGKINSNLEFSKTGTRTLMLALLETENLSKIFIEEHLKQRCNLNDSRIRFHGCRAVRHDDHIHLQVKH